MYLGTIVYSITVFDVFRGIKREGLVRHDMRKTTEGNAAGYFTVALFQCIFLHSMGQSSVRKMQCEILLK